MRTSPEIPRLIGTTGTHTHLHAHRYTLVRTHVHLPSISLQLCRTLDHRRMKRLKSSRTLLTRITSPVSHASHGTVLLGEKATLTNQDVLTSKPEGERVTERKVEGGKFYLEVLVRLLRGTQFLPKGSGQRQSD